MRSAARSAAAASSRAPASWFTSAWTVSASASITASCVPETSAPASSASWRAVGNWPRRASSLARLARHRGLGVEVVGRGERLGFLGQLLRLVEASLPVDHLGEPAYGRAEVPALAHLAKRRTSFPQVALGRGQVPADQLHLSCRGYRRAARSAAQQELPAPPQRPAAPVPPAAAARPAAAPARPGPPAPDRPHRAEQAQLQRRTPPGTQIVLALLRSGPP